MPIIIAQRYCLSFSFIAVLATNLCADKNDWAEGTPGQANGASRDYYNRAGLLAWKNFMGDWLDAGGVPQGDRPFAKTTVVDDDTQKFVEWDVGQLVQDWIRGTVQNQGFLLRGVAGSGTFEFGSRERADKNQRPALLITTRSDTFALEPEADTYLDPSTYRSLGNGDRLKVASGSNASLIRFDLSGISRETTVQQARLRLHTHRQYGGGSMEIGVFRCSQGHDLPPSNPIPGLAAAYGNDAGISRNSQVVFFEDFESSGWADRWSFAQGNMNLVTSDGKRKFKPLLGKALRVKIAEGSTGALNLGYKFQKETGQEPEEIFFRYYLRFGDDWNQTLQGGKLPGISGTYGVAGWGGRPSDGTDGWSARGAFHCTIPADNPLAHTTPIGTYCYHADMEGQYGNIWLWQEGYRGFLEKNRWYCIEQYLKMNTPGRKDGVIRAWVDGRLAFEKTDIRFRNLDRLKVEQIWMNVYHGGTKPSPYDQHLFIDNVVIAKRHIGPLGSARGDLIPPTAPKNFKIVE